MTTLIATQEQTLVQKRIKRSFYDKFKIWFYQNRFGIFGSISLVSQISFIYYGYIPKVQLFQEEKIYEDIAFVASLQLADPVTKQTTSSEGEIKEVEKLEKVEKEDPRIATAQNPFLVGATLPVDLTPDIKPEYPVKARALGIEGVVTLEVVIADDGSVLRVLAMNKPIGFGLEEAAIAAFRKKKYQPSTLDGKPITIKVMIPVQFRLR